MLPYKYTVHEAVLKTFMAAKKSHREHLLVAFAQLASNPFELADTIQVDRTGRNLQVKRFDVWTITYWPDHYAHQVYIVAIELLRN